jgi:hypothetical protein
MFITITEEKMETVKMVIPIGDDTAQNRRTGCARQSSHRYSSESDVRGEGESSIGNQQRRAVVVRASRYRQSLSLVADSILDDHGKTEAAVRNCLFAVSRNPARLDSEGAFRSWLVRKLIDEALLLLPSSSND